MAIEKPPVPPVGPAASDSSESGPERSPDTAASALGDAPAPLPSDARSPSRDLRARDVLNELEHRASLADRTVARVGRRAWKRPNVAISGRLYRFYKLQDPWDPESTGDTDPGLGPVSLMFDERRRKPAPHLKPKETAKPKAEDPVAGYRREANRPAPSVKAEAKPPPSPPSRPPSPSSRPPSPSSPTPSSMLPEGSQTGEFGGSSRHELKGKIPVRPDMGDGNKPPSRMLPGRLTGEFGGTPTPGLRAPLPQRPDLAREAESAGSQSTPAPRARPPEATPRPAPLARPTKPNNARVSLRPTATQSPVVMAPPPPEVVQPVAGAGPTILDVGEPVPPPVSKAPESKIDRTPKAVSGGLDDLFGAMSEGRMSIRRARKKPASEEGE